MDIDLAGLAASRSLVLVEGDSDKAALETLAMRRGRNLAGEGVAVVAMGGATNIGRFLALAGRGGSDSASPGCAMRARKITSAVPWHERAPGVLTAGERWRSSASGCARRISRTS